MQVVTIVSRAEYLTGKCITGSLALKNVKKLRVNVALSELLNVALLSGIGMFSFGFQQLSQLGMSVVKLSSPSIPELASFTFFAISLSFLAKAGKRLLSELATSPHSMAVVGDMNAWIKHIESGSTGSTFNVAILTDSGLGMTLELYGTRAGGEPLMIAMTSSRYSRVYDRTSITDKTKILTRLASGNICFPKGSLETLISAPNTLPQPGSAV